MRSVGYRQAWAYLEDEIDRNTLRAQGVAATRQLAKRQFTWLQSVSAMRVPPDLNQAIETIVAHVKRLHG